MQNILPVLLPALVASLPGLAALALALHDRRRRRREEVELRVALAQRHDHDAQALARLYEAAGAATERQLHTAGALVTTLAAAQEDLRKALVRHAQIAQIRAGHLEASASEARALVGELRALIAAIAEGRGRPLPPPPSGAEAVDEGATRVLEAPAPSASAPRARLDTLVSRSGS